MINSDRLNQIIGILPTSIKEKIHLEQFNYMKLREIRIRVNQFVRVRTDKEEVVLPDCKVEEGQIYELIEKACEYSLYSYEENMKQGFVTIRGGHRIGIGGQVLMEQGKVKTISRITFLCIRVAHEVIGCADDVMDFVCRNGMAHTLIVSPPGFGKTTLLRDMVRQISDGTVFSDGSVFPGKNICVIDERSELAACFKGVPQNRMGIRTDVLDHCPKSEGMLMAVRALSPQVIAVDEIGGMKDVEAVMYCIHCGCTVFGTVHGWDEKELLLRPGISKLLENGAFQRMIFLSERETHRTRCVEWGERI